VFWFSPQLSCETFFVLRRTERDIITNVCWSSCKLSVILVTFNGTWIFSTDLKKNTNISNFTKSVRWEPSCFMWTNRWTDRHDEANSRSSQFCERTYKVLASNVPHTVPVHIWDNYNCFRNQIFLQAELLRIIYCTYTSISFYIQIVTKMHHSYPLLILNSWRSHTQPQHDNFIMAVFKILRTFLPLRLTSSVRRTKFLWN
jgi:hypothetical protein